jgi:hypothetical protein
VSGWVRSRSRKRRDLLVQDAYAALRPMLEEKGDPFLGRLMVAWGPLRAALARGGSEQAARPGGAAARGHRLVPRMLSTFTRGTGNRARGIGNGLSTSADTATSPTPTQP